MFPVLSTAKLIGLVVAAAAILSFVLLALHWKSTMEDRGAQLATICASVRAAADNPKMDCKLASQQIGLMGQDIANLKTGIARQNAAVNAQVAESDRQKAEAAQAVQKAQGRAQAAQATADRLAASSRSGEAQAKPCAPSKALTEAWR